MSSSEYDTERTGLHRGVAVGIVTANDDPEGVGRVRVTYPWRESDDESYWARIAAPMGGSEMGAYFLPEVGDEVLVAFDGGDIDHPYVVGALWSGEQPPPEDNADGENAVRTIRSRSGHEIRLVDSSTEGRVEITSSAGHSITLDDTPGEEKVSIEDHTGTNKIELDAVQGAIDVSSGAKLSVNAPMLEIKGDGNVTLEAGGILTLQGALININ